MRQIFIDNSIYFNRVAILENGKLEDFFLEEKGSKRLLGNIYKCKVVDILPGMEAAFVDVGLEKNAYLHINALLSDKFVKDKNINRKDVKNINQVLKNGEEILVQINREPIGEKSISVTTDISLPGKNIALIPKSNEVNVSKKITENEERKRLKQIGREIMIDDSGMIMRTSADGLEREVIQREYNLLQNIYNQIEKEYRYSYAPKLLYKSDEFLEKLFQSYVNSDIDEIYTEGKENRIIVSELIKKFDLVVKLSHTKIIYTDDDIFNIYGVENQIDTLFDRKIELHSGGSIFIDVTEALTVIDVNTGKFVGSKNLEETALSINLSATNEIARQIKLRDISGIIIIDFIDMKDINHIEQVIRQTKKAFEKDEAKTKILGMTKLNLLEMTRKKDKENFFNRMTKDCSHCEGRGKVNSIVRVVSKLENILKKAKKSTSCEAIVISMNRDLYKEIDNNCKKYIESMENEYKIKIYLISRYTGELDEIHLERMGKLEYIKQYVSKIARQN